MSYDPNNMPQSGNENREETENKAPRFYDTEGQQPQMTSSYEHPAQPAQQPQMTSSYEHPAQPAQQSQMTSSYEQPAQPAQQPQMTSSYQHPMQQVPHTSYQQPTGGKKPPKKSKSAGILIGICSVAAAILLFAGGAALGSQLMTTTGANGDDSASAQNTAAETISITDAPSYDAANYDAVNGLAGEEIYKKVNPSMVTVVAQSLQQGTAYGSGVVATEDGYIITNQHVIADTDAISVQLADGTQEKAQLIGQDEQTDLAVLKINTSHPLTAAEFGNSDELQPGEYAYAIGSPGGLELANTITGGRISAINRDITVDDRVMTLIQTDASINPGNSGGALINKYGQVVGITSAKLGISYYEGLGFAIPINTAKDIVDQLVATGYIAGRPSIGITGYNVTEQTAAYNNVPQGVYVQSVDSRAAAASQGLQAKDIITAVNGQTITTMDEINEIKKEMKAGDALKLTVYRMSTGETLELTITLTDQHDLSNEVESGNSQELQPYPGDYGYDSGDNSGDNSGNSNSGDYFQDPFSYFFR